MALWTCTSCTRIEEKIAVYTNELANRLTKLTSLLNTEEMTPRNPKEEQLYTLPIL